MNPFKFYLFKVPLVSWMFFINSVFDQFSNYSLSSTSSSEMPIKHRRSDDAYRSFSAVRFIHLATVLLL